MMRMKIKVLVLFLLFISISAFASINGVVSISPSSPTYLDDLNCTFTLNDSTNVTLGWYKNGTLFSTTTYTNVSEGSSIISFKLTRSGQNWTCAVTFDNTTISDTVTIGQVYSFDFASENSLPSLINDFMGEYSDLLLAVFSLGVVWYVGKSFSMITLSYSVVTFTLYLLLSSPLLLYIAIISLVVGLLLRLTGG